MFYILLFFSLVLTSGVLVFQDPILQASILAIGLLVLTAGALLDRGKR